MNEIGLKRYRLLFYGNVLDEADPTAAQRALAERYDLAADKLAMCFSGRKVALHSDLSERDAYRIQTELEDHGLITHLELLDSNSPATPPDTPVKARAVFTPPSAVTSHRDQHHDRQVIHSSCHDAPRDNDSDNSPSQNAALASKAGIIKLALLSVALLSLIAGATWLAFPIYQQQQNHTHIRNAIGQVEDVSNHLRGFIDKTGFWPNSNLDAGLDDPKAFQSDAVASIRIGSKALIIATLNEALDDIGGQTLLFVPQRGTDRIVRWRCDGGTLASQWRPAECIAPADNEYQRKEAAERLTLAVSIPAIPSNTDSIGPSERKIQKLLRDEISNTVHVRQAIMQMMTFDGLWPTTNSEAGLPAARLISSSAFRKVEVLPEGRILYVFSDQIPSFEGHKLWLVPSAIGEWRCESSFEERYLPTPCSASITH